MLYLEWKLIYQICFFYEKVKIALKLPFDADIAEKFLVSTRHLPLTALLTYFVHRISSSSTCSLHSALVDRKEKLSFQIFCLEIDWLFTCSAHFDKSMTSSVLSSCIIYQPKILAGISFYFLYAMH